MTELEILKEILKKVNEIYDWVDTYQESICDKNETCTECPLFLFGTCHKINMH